MNGLPFSDDDDVPGKLAETLLGIATGKIVERRASEIGVLSLKCAELGLSTMHCMQFEDKSKPESPARAVVCVLAGELPEDLITLVIDYVRGAAQEYTNNRPDLKLFHESNELPPRPDAP